jgi:hypothetical protein
MYSKNQSINLALKAIESGQPNRYLGNPGIVNDFDLTPLVILAEKDSELVKYALEHGADLLFGEIII